MAGNPFRVDREFLAKELGFSFPTPNSMHATGDRDFIMDILYCCSMIMTHLSRLAEDLIIFSSAEFAYISLSDQFSTGSSLMPQVMHDI
jgi:argininosuccinate lyase